MRGECQTKDTIVLHVNQSFIRLLIVLLHSLCAMHCPVKLLLGSWQSTQRSQSVAKLITLVVSLSCSLALGHKLGLSCH